MTSSDRLCVTAVTTWFPTQSAPSRGSFVARDLAAIALDADVRLIHLVPPQDDDGTRHLSHPLPGGGEVDVVRIPMSPRSPASVLGAARALPALLAGADVVHTMAYSSLLPFALRRPRAPWVHTEHWSALTTPETLPAPARLGLPALTTLLRRPDIVTGVCEFLAEPIRRARGPRPTAVVPCVVDPVDLVPRRDRSDRALRLVSTGGLIERKDPLIAVETLAHLVREDVDAHLVWLGDGPLRERTQARAERLGVADRLELTGSVDAAEVRRRLGEADLFFGPTRADNFFVSAAEAIVSGRPVVLGATGGQGEYVRESVGALVIEQSAARYARAIREVDARTRHLSSEEIAATIGDAFSTPVVGRGYRAVHADAIALAAGAEPSTVGGVRPVGDKAAPHEEQRPSRPVEVVIACHTPQRPIGRAVRSILHGNEREASVLVVCHNRTREEIAAAIDPEDRDRVRYLEHSDPRPSASGPFNAGIAASTADLVAIMGSDDTLAPGAVASWLRIRRRTGADLVMTRLALGSPRRAVPTPPTRPWLRGAADLVLDRLAYRSAPLGLIARERWMEDGLRLAEGVPVGGDVELVTRMCAQWSVAVDRSGPPYVIGEDAGDRVTYVLRPLDVQLGFIEPLIGAGWFRALSPAARAAIVVKLLRIHVFGAVFYRNREETWTEEERASLARVCGALLRAAPGAEAVLSRADRQLLDACLNQSVTAPRLIRRAQARRRHGRPVTLVPRRLAHALDREAPLRLMAASAASIAIGRLARRGRDRHRG